MNWPKGGIERGDRAPSLESLEKIAEALGIDPAELLNFKGREFRALAEAPLECLELWNLPRNKKRDQIKKVYEIAKIVLGQSINHNYFPTVAAIKREHEGL